MPNILRYAKPRAADQHPNAKPVELAARFIAAHTTPGQVVLDPFCGGGTTLLAAEKLGRQWIGMELDQKWAAQAERRVAAEAAQGKLL